ncbi:MAG: hypothetical protein KDC48_07315 [Planctomycetes bacterium]|nr:hypothetical protein [Planctomycetota bacterium]
MTRDGEQVLAEAIRWVLERVDERRELPVSELFAAPVDVESPGEAVTVLRLRAMALNRLISERRLGFWVVDEVVGAEEGEGSGSYLGAGPHGWQVYCRVVVKRMVPGPE